MLRITDTLRIINKLPSYIKLYDKSGSRSNDSVSVEDVPQGCSQYLYLLGSFCSMMRLSKKLGKIHLIVLNVLFVTRPRQIQIL